MALSRGIREGPPVLDQRPTLVVTWFCPFAQRTWLAAEAKQLIRKGLVQVHEMSYEDLYGKPPWFTDLNPAGLVPLLAWQQEGGGGPKVVAESLICNEYLEEAFPPSDGYSALLPACPFERAQARTTIDGFCSKAVPAFYKMLVRQDPAQQAAAAAAFTQAIQWWLQRISPTGPFALGPQLSLVDCAVAPFLLRLPVLEHYRQYKAGEVLEASQAERLQAYLEAVTSSPEVLATQAHPEGKIYADQLLNTYERYANGTAGSMMAHDAKKD